MRWLAYLVLIIAQFAIFDHLSKLDGPFGANLFLMGLMTVVAIFFHEIGHAIAAWRTGATVHSIVVSFVRYDVARRRFDPAPASKAREVGGYVSYSFEERVGTMRKENYIAAAGPFANAFTAILALLMASAIVTATPPPLDSVEVMPTGPADLERMRAKPVGLPSEAAIQKAMGNADAQKRREFWKTTLQAFAILSFGLALTNLVPFQGSDGETILRNLRNSRSRTRRR